VKVAVPELLRRSWRAAASGCGAAWYADMSDVQRREGADVFVMGSSTGRMSSWRSRRERCQVGIDTRRGVDHYPLERILRQGMLLTKGQARRGTDCGVGSAVHPVGRQGFRSSSRRAHAVNGHPPAGGDGVGRVEGADYRYGAIGRAVRSGCGLWCGGGGRQTPHRWRARRYRETHWRDRLQEFDWIVLTAA